MTRSGRIEDLRRYWRFVAGLRSFLRTPSIEECRSLLAERAANRDDSFLRVLRYGIYARPSSPYRLLLECARISFEDIERSVRASGIESTLNWLYEAGVYITLEEFKGRKPILRPGSEAAVSAVDFDNPIAAAQVEIASGGSGGRAQAVAIDLDGWVHDAACHVVFAQGAGVLDRPFGLWRPVPPGGAGLERAFEFLRLGLRFERWFSQEDPSWRSMRARYWLVMRTALTAARLSGRTTPEPRHVPLGEAEVVARWLAEQCAVGDPAYLDSNVSSAVRVCRAAEESGLDLAGTFMRVGSEAFTPAKAEVLDRAGCRATCHYATAEAGTIGYACTDARYPDEGHLTEGRHAILQPPADRNGGRPAGALFLTTLQPSASKLMLNVEMGDYAVVERRRCGCPFSDLGFHTHIHTIRSYEKLTTEGMHFLGSALIELVESVLPERFAGGPGDYQLVERESDGLTKIELVVSPTIGPLDEEAALDVALSHLGAESEGNRMMADVWRQGRTLRVVRREPYATSASKVPPLYRVRS